MPLAFGCASGVVYFAILCLTLSVSSLNGLVLIRPTLGLGPALSLFFGWPAVVGCLVGDAAAHLLFGMPPETLVLALTDNLVYFAGPWLLWYAIFSRSRHPYPRLDTAAKTAALFAVLTLAAVYDGVVCMFLNPQALLLEADRWLVFVLYFNNDFLFSMFLGVPLLIALERSPLPPRPPRWIRAPYRREETMTLSQTLVLLMLAVAAVIVVVLNIVDAGIGLEGAEAGLRTFADLTGIDEAVALVDGFLTEASVHLAIVLTITLVVLFYLHSRVAVPVEAVTRAASGFAESLARAREAGGEAPELEPLVPGPSANATVRSLMEGVDAMRGDLVSYMDEVERSARERERTATELAIATRIQLDAVPDDFATLPDAVDASAVVVPARSVGGDFYDLFPAGEGRLGVVMADVSDKGMPAALFMMRAMAVIREQLTVSHSVAEAVGAANDALAERNDQNMFVTVFAGILDLATGRLDYVNAGHEPPWRLGSDPGWLKARSGPMLGAFAGIPYRSLSVTLGPGDGIVLYTDGVTEARNGDGELFGLERLEGELERIGAAAASGRMSGDRYLRERDAFLKRVAGTRDPAMARLSTLFASEHGATRSAETVFWLMESLAAFTGSAEQSDDVTVLALYRRPGLS